MAEEKKEMRKAGKLYDHPSSQKARGEQPGDAKKQTVKDRESEAAGAARSDEEKAESAGMDQVKTGADSVMEGYRALVAAHESERNDMNGNHVAERKAMHKRHEGAMKDFLSSQGMGVGTGEQGGDGEEAEA